MPSLTNKVSESNHIPSVRTELLPDPLQLCTSFSHDPRSSTTSLARLSPEIYLPSTRGGKSLTHIWDIIAGK